MYRSLPFLEPFTLVPLLTNESAEANNKQRYSLIQYDAKMFGLDARIQLLSLVVAAEVIYSDTKYCIKKHIHLEHLQYKIILR